MKRAYYNLAALEFHRTGNMCMVPAARDDDFGRPKRITNGLKSGYDALAFWHTRPQAPKHVQIKTTPTKERYVSDITVVALSELGHPAGSRTRADDLPRMLQRQIEGKAIPAEKAQIKSAQTHLRTIIFGH